MNTFGTIFRLTTAGESHGPALVGIIDGMPAGFKIDFEKIRLDMNRRRPGQSYSSSRNETDDVSFLSGLLNGVTLGTPIAFSIPNSDAKSEDYDHLKKTFRPSHADFTYHAKYGIRDIRGGGRASARETALRVVAGSLAMQVLENNGINIEAFTSQVGKIRLDSDLEIDSKHIWESPIGCPDRDVSDRMLNELECVKKAGNTVGCEVSCIITGLPAGIGEPIYDKLSARLAYAMLSINAAHSFNYGDDMIGCYGSEVTDAFEMRSDGAIVTQTNHSGGIQGGISNGMPVTFRVGFKPLPSLMLPVESVNNKGEKIVIKPRGRHDVCAVPRAVPVVRAMAAITVLDLLLLSRLPVKC